MPTTVTDLEEQVFKATLYECRQALPDIEPFEPECFEPECDAHKVLKTSHEYAYNQYLGLIDSCMLVQDFKYWLEDDLTEKFVEPEAEAIQKAIEVCISDCDALMEA